MFRKRPRIAGQLWRPNPVRARMLTSGGFLLATGLILVAVHQLLSYSVTSYTYIIGLLGFLIGFSAKAKIAYQWKLVREDNLFLMFSFVSGPLVVRGTDKDQAKLDKYYEYDKGFLYCFDLCHSWCDGADCIRWLIS